MARTSAMEKTTRSRVRLKYVDVHCLRVFRFVKRKICSFTVEVGRRTFECDRDRLGCQPPRICLPRSSVLVIWVYNFPLHDGELCLFWQPVPGIGRCECEGHTSLDCCFVSGLIESLISRWFVQLVLYKCRDDHSYVHSKFT